MDLFKTWLADEQPTIVSDPEGCGKNLLIRHSISRLQDRLTGRSLQPCCTTHVVEGRAPEVAPVLFDQHWYKWAHLPPEGRTTIGLLHERYQSAITQQVRHFRDRDFLVPGGNAQWLLRRRPRVPMPSRRRSKPTYGHCRILAMVSRFG